MFNGQHDLVCLDKIMAGQQLGNAGNGAGCRVLNWEYGNIGASGFQTVGDLLKIATAQALPSWVFTVGRRMGPRTFRTQNCVYELINQFSLPLQHSSFWRTSGIFLATTGQTLA